MLSKNKSVSANFSERSLRYMPSPVRPSVCRLSVTLACILGLLNRLKFSAMFLRHLVSWPSVDIYGNGKFYGDRPRGTTPPPSSAGLNARGVAKCSDVWPVEGYISEMVHARYEVSYKKSISAFYWHPNRWRWITLNGVMAVILRYITA